jgi:hypothetical protein
MAAPRLDGRFLLPEPQLRRVGYAGEPDDELLAALRSHGASVERLGPRGTADSYDVILAHEPSEPELAQAARCVRPGGFLIVESRGPLEDLLRRRSGRDRRRGRAPGAGAIARRLSLDGFEGVRSYWHWPDFEHCTRIVPLDDSAAFAFGTRRGEGTRARLIAGLARLAPLKPWVVGCTSTVARRPEPSRNVGPGQGTAGVRAASPPPSSLVHAFLEERSALLGLSGEAAQPGASFVALTPRFRNSTHLIFLLLPRGGREPVLVAKVPRSDGPSAKSEGEARRLSQIQSARPGGFDSIPRLLAFEAFRGHPILLETALQGRPMNRAMVRAQTEGCCAIALEWLLEVQRATRRDHEPGEIERSIVRDLADLEAAFPEDADLVRKTRDRMAPLAQSGLPLVLEHRDLSHPNLLVDDRGKLAVLDWELAELRGIPALDLFFFLSYVARALRGALSNAAAAAAVDQAFLGSDGWARAQVRRYALALELPLDTLTPLFVAGWVRQVNGLMARLADGNPSGLHGELAASVRQDWRFLAWRAAVERSDALDWTR